MGRLHEPNGTFTRRYAKLRTSKGKWRLDKPMLDEIADMMQEEGLSTLVDFGGGTGLCAGRLREKGVQAVGLDGILSIERLSGGKVLRQDLTQPFDRGVYDVVMSIDVGEHLPPETLGTFMENVVRHCARWLVLSWGDRGQRGTGHVSCLTPEEVVEMAHSYGFAKCSTLTQRLRKVSHISRKSRLHVFDAPTHPE